MKPFKTAETLSHLWEGLAELFFVPHALIDSAMSLNGSLCGPCLHLERVAQYLIILQTVYGLHLDLLAAGIHPVLWSCPASMRLRTLAPKSLGCHTSPWHWVWTLVSLGVYDMNWSLRVRLGIGPSRFCYPLKSQWHPGIQQRPRLMVAQSPFS